MIARIGMVAALALAFSVVETSQAEAQCGLQGGYGFDIGRLYGQLGQNVPHFAAYPPVYYSAPIPRTYGYSPFAYPPGTMTPDLPTPTVAAKEIINPYVRASTTADEKPAEQTADKVTARENVSQPLAIVNPFVDSPLTGPVLHAVALNR